MKDDYYLLETEYEDETRMRLLMEDGLASELTRNIERHHYTGDGEDIKGLYRYVSPGQLQELVIVCRGEERTLNDFLEWSYSVHERADSEAFGVIAENEVFSFAVTIDGRA